jgi:hypothetical protein
LRKADAAEASEESIRKLLESMKISYWFEVRRLLDDHTGARYRFVTPGRLPGLPFPGGTAWIRPAVRERAGEGRMHALGFGVAIGS